MSLELPKKRRNWRKLSWTCFFEYEDKTGQIVRGGGRTMNVNGIVLELFPSSVLCGMLHKQLKTLYGWERDFGFPRALWNIRDDLITNRWYSRKQLIGIRTVWEHCGRLKKENRAKLRQFIAAIREFFYQIDNPEASRGAQPAATSSNSPQKM